MNEDGVIGGNVGGELGTPEEYRTDDGDEFITVKQAALVAGVSDRSIQRYVKDLIDSHSEQDSLLLRREMMSGGGFRYRISKRAVTERFKNVGKGELLDTVDRSSEKQRKEVVEMYKLAIANLERERETLVSELEKKNNQIEMLEKARERSDILLQQSNDRVKLLENPSQKKRRWFSWGNRE